jgi:hypothetical protein
VYSFATMDVSVAPLHTRETAEPELAALRDAIQREVTR